MNIKEIRYQNVRKLVAQTGRLAIFGEKIGKAPAQVSSFAGENPRKGIGDEMALHIEQCFGLPRGWMDKNHEEAEVPVTSANKTVHQVVNDKYQALLQLGREIDDFTPIELEQLFDQVALIRKRKNGGA